MNILTFGDSGRTGHNYFPSLRVQLFPSFCGNDISLLSQMLRIFMRVSDLGGMVSFVFSLQITL